MGTYSILKRAAAFFDAEVIPWWQNVACKLPPSLAPHVGHLLLSGIYLSVQRLLEVQQFGVNYLNIENFQLVANATATRIVDRETNGRLRKVTLWVDAATGQLPTIRLSTGAFGAGGGGIRIIPGQANLIGEVPPDAQLYAASTQTINVYVFTVA